MHDSHKEVHHLGISSALFFVCYSKISALSVTRLIFNVSFHPANTRRSPNAGTMLAHRLRRWANIVPTLGERPVFAGHYAILMTMVYFDFSSYKSLSIWTQNGKLPSLLWIIHRRSHDRVLLSLEGALLVGYCCLCGRNIWLAALGLPNSLLPA